MAEYRFTQNYVSSYGEGRKGDVVELTDQEAADINRDAPGTLEPVTEQRAVEKAPSNRQVTSAKNRSAKGGKA